MRPWDAVASRVWMLEMERSKRYQVSDDGDGEGYKRLLGPARAWLRSRCEEALRDKDDFWALRRTHESDFLERLNRVMERSKAELLRQRGRARSILLAAELLGLDMSKVEERLTQAIAAEDLESENVTVIEAIESDPLFQLEEVGFEEFRLSVQKYLRERKESIDLTRNRFAEVLKEMEFSRVKGPTWKKVERDGRVVVMIFPALWRRNKSQTSGKGQLALHMENPPTPPTRETGPPGPGEAVLAMHEILRGLCDGRRSAYLEDVLRLAQERGIAPDRTQGVLKRLRQEGSIFEPVQGAYRLTEGLA
jgi:hypothetical protein